DAFSVPFADGHSRVFELLACTRNTAHAADLRMECAQELMSAAERFVENDSSIFHMFLLIYQTYLALLTESDPAPHVNALWLWCSEQNRSGLGSWSRRLAPVLITRPWTLNWGDRLCEAIPHH